MARKRQIIDWQKTIDFILICVLVALAYIIGRHDAIEYQKYITEYCEKVLIYQLSYQYFTKPQEINTTLNISLIFNITNH